MMTTREATPDQHQAAGTLEAGGGAFVSPVALASYWNVRKKTIYRDIRKGALRAFKLPGGHLRIRRDDAFRYGRPID